MITSVLRKCIQQTQLCNVINILLAPKQ